MHVKQIKMIAGIGLVVAAVGTAWAFSHPKTAVPQSAAGNTARSQMLAIENTIPTQAGKNSFEKQSNNLTQSVDPELVDLDSQIITCSPTVDSLLSGAPSYGGSCVAAGGSLPNANGLYLGGQCCGALTDTAEYHENLEKLHAYKNMPNIPLDPMHTPVAMAKQWIDYDNAAKLTSVQQTTFDQAMDMSKEKPCCCKCWHYYVNEGVAKKMIQDKTFNAQQIAAFWDASDICG